MTEQTNFYTPVTTPISVTGPNGITWVVKDEYMSKYFQVVTKIRNGTSMTRACRQAGLSTSYYYLIKKTRGDQVVPSTKYRNLPRNRKAKTTKQPITKFTVAHKTDMNLSVSDDGRFFSLTLSGLTAEQMTKLLTAAFAVGVRG